MRPPDIQPVAPGRTWGPRVKRSKVQVHFFLSLGGVSLVVAPRLSKAAPALILSKESLTGMGLRTSEAEPARARDAGNQRIFQTRQLFLAQGNYKATNHIEMVASAPWGP